MRFGRTTVLIMSLLACDAATGLASPDTEALARRLLNSQGCKACHRLEGDGGQLAAPLDDVGARLTRSAIAAQLDNPERRHGSGPLPDFHHLDPAQRDALVDFLAGRKASPQKSAPPNP